MKKTIAYIILLLLVSAGCRSKKMAMIDPPKAVTVNPATGESPRSKAEQLMLTEKQKKKKRKKIKRKNEKIEERYKKEVLKYQKTKNSIYSRKLIKKNKKHARKYRKRYKKRGHKFFLWRWLGI